MRQVTFSLGPFLDQYEDGHPPEKDCEDERRRYRTGVPSKADLESNDLDGQQFEEAFQAWLEKYKERFLTPTVVEGQKEGAFLVGPLPLENAEGESIPVSDYSYRSFKADGIGKNSKECFVIDITAIPCSAENETEKKSPQTRQSILSCWQTRRSVGETARCAIARQYKHLILYVKHLAIGALIMLLVLILINM